jgi:P-aminobenzoate N-oxygenase AurF
MPGTALKREDWSRERFLLRPAKLTSALVDTGSNPDVSRPWVPEILLPLYGAPSFAALSNGQRLCYNQAYARQLVEEFIWLERYMILAPVQRLSTRSGVDSDVSFVLSSFASDERNHVAGFSRLRELAIRVSNPATSRPLFNPPRLVRALARLASQFPTAFAFWTTVIQAFEEYAVKIGQTYKRDRNVDRLFKDVFVAHAQDEARHCRYDDLLTDWLRPSGATSSFHTRVADLFQSRYRSLGWGIDGPIRELVQVHPDLAGNVHVMIAEAKATRRSGLPPISPE